MVGWKEINFVQTLLYGFCSNWYITANKPEDVTYSSYSMFVAFSFLYIGSKGETKKQLGKVFGFSQFEDICSHDGISPDDTDAIERMNDEKLKEILIELVNHNTEASNILVQVVNGIWVDQSIQFKTEYMQAVEKLHCQLQSVNFAQKGEEIRKEINTFVEKATFDVIKDFLQPGTITADTVSVIVNAIYFKGDWNTPFTLMKGDFIFDQTQHVQGMSEELKASAIFTSEYTSVSIPYSDLDHSLVIVMPENMTEFEKKYFSSQHPVISSQSFKLADMFINTRQEMAEKRLVQMPKFKIESSFNMNSQLQQLGLTDVFCPSADFSNMCDTNISVSSAIHKCVVDVDEEGTVAAAATGIVMMRCCMIREQPREVIINKPFFFAIVGGEMNIPLFFGKISHPKH